MTVPRAHLPHPPGISLLSFSPGAPLSIPLLFKVVVVHLLSCPTLRPQTIAHRLPCPSLYPGICSNLCPMSRGCHPIISFSAIPFSFCLQSFQASGSFPMSQLFTSGSQTIGAPASAPVLPVNIQR